MAPPPAPRGPGRRRGHRHHSTTASLFSDADAAGEYDPAAGDADADADAEGEEEDADAEGEMDDYDGEGMEAGDGDDGVYCTCRQKSYGEMIACDNSNCDIEWVSWPREPQPRCRAHALVPRQVRRRRGRAARNVVLPRLRDQAGVGQLHWTQCSGQGEQEGPKAKVRSAVECTQALR